jgi:hypothetical protein
MSLLEKATSGNRQKEEVLRGATETRPARSSLFAKAMASSAEKPEIAIYELDGLDDARSSCSSLPQTYDSIFAEWKVLTSPGLHLSALALFLPQGDFLALAARLGFPACSGDSIPVSIAPPSKKPCELLGKDERALIAPILGVPVGMSLRATAMWSDSGLYGLWVYHDPSLEAASEEIRSELAAFLSSCGDRLPQVMMEYGIPNPTPAILASIRKYASVSLFRFDLGPLFADGESFPGAEAHAIRSSYLAACRKILGAGGMAYAYGDYSIVCALGSSSSSDAGLALFQFSKTLKRILPYFATAALPEGRSMSLEPSRSDAAGQLSRFLSA